VQSVEKGQWSTNLNFLQWPPIRSDERFSLKFPEGGKLTIIAVEDGSFRVALFSPQNTPIDEFQSPRILFSSVNDSLKPSVNVSIRWKNHKVRDFYINETDIPSITDTSQPVTIPLTFKQPPKELSIQHPHAKENCKGWCVWRQLNLIKQPRQLVGRTLKSTEEVISEFKSALSRLISLNISTRNGELVWVGTIATELRALLEFCENPADKRCTRMPLLLRVAAMMDAELPIYRFAQSQGQDLRFSDQDHNFMLVGPPLIMAEGQISELVDIQEWLISDFIYLKQCGWQSGIRFIGECAATFGPAHYDPYLSDTAQALMNLQLLEENFLANYLVAFADTIIFLGLHLLENIEDQLCLHNSYANSQEL
jgi:hypothetical protein